MDKREQDAKIAAAGKRLDEELALKRDEFELNKARFELERKEREARIDAEKKEKDLKHALLTNLLATNRQ